jgi:multicomponent Na+:H+ antiporter subunit E
VNVITRGGVLVLFWFLAWGDFSAANLVSGTVVAVVLLVVFPPRRTRTPGIEVSLVGAVRLTAYLLGQLVPSNVLVARIVLGRTSDAGTGVVAYQLQDPSDEALTLMAHVIALTPGTMAVDADPVTGILHVHFLRLDDFDTAQRALRRIDELVTATVGRPESHARDREAG